MVDVNKLFGKDYREFSETDPFNPKNTVEGYISRKSNEFYGALIITRINNHEVEPQLIMGTPKMHYPFNARADGSRNYAFPSAKGIEIYEKLDGTNILAFCYLDKYYRYFSYKTRLRPFAGSGRFGNFYGMWMEVGQPYFPQIRELMNKHNCNLSFELYGARNPHLVLYPNPLDIALLFGVTNSGRIMSPTDLQLATRDKYVPQTDIPLVKRFNVIGGDYVWNYERVQKELQEALIEVEDEHYMGVEGTVWYLKSLDNLCIQLKCKPETIEAIHFASGGMSRNSIIATCWNAYENTDNPTVEFVKQLLLEEFKPNVIEASHYRIANCVEFVKGQMQFRQTVLDEYRKLGKNILLEKNEVMRELSKKFDRSVMRKVYSAITNFA